MKYRIDVKKGGWYIPLTKKLWGWQQISGGRLNRTDAIIEIGKHALGEQG